MRIVIVGTAYPYRDGLAAYNERLAREFMAQGHEVRIITFKLQYPKLFFPGKSQYSSEHKPEDLHISREINAVSPLNWIRVGLKIKKISPDKVIFSYGSAFMASCFGMIARIAGAGNAKMIGLVHDMTPQELSAVGKSLSRYFVDSVDGFVAMAGTVVAGINFFDDKGKAKVISPHPIYDHYGEKVDRALAAMRLGLHVENKYVLFFGYISHYKGLDLLLEAFADPRLEQFPVRLIIAGEFYENPEPYLKLIRKLKLESRVELRATFIPDKDVRNYFSVADIVAQPYRSAAQSGVSQIAYHYETPMLVTNVGGLSEIVPHNKVGYVVNGDPARIADALFDFFSNERGDEFKGHLKEEKKKYAWSEMTGAINSI